MFYLGGRGSETNAHEHTNAYNTLFFGAKLFLLFPPLQGHWRETASQRCGLPLDARRGFRVE